MGLDGRRPPSGTGAAAADGDSDAGSAMLPIMDDSDDGDARARAAAAACFGLVSGPPPFADPRDAKCVFATSCDARRTGPVGDGLTPVAPLIGGIAGTIVGCGGWWPYEGDRVGEVPPLTTTRDCLRRCTRESNP